MLRTALLSITFTVAIAAAGAFASGAASLRLVVVARGLESPVHVTQASGEPDRLYVVEQIGRIRILERGALATRPFLDIRDEVVAGGEQGLLGLAFSPTYARDRTFYVNYTASGSGATTIVRYRANRAGALTASARVVLRVEQPYVNHNGGHLLFGPDRRLWIGLGDGGSGGDPENRAQDPNSRLGKMLRLNVGAADPKPEIVAFGLRNPWRYSFDRRTGDLWIGDVGQGEVEEIDRWQRPGRELVNFGWDVYEGSRSFERKALGPGRLIQPVAQYTHARGCSVTGGYVYRGKAIPRLAGRYVYGDYCSGTIWSIPATGRNARVEPVRVPDLSSFYETLDGERLYAVALSGTIYRFSR